MKLTLMATLLACAATGAASQSLTGSLNASHDSDAFNEKKESLAYEGVAGWGLKATAMQYDSPGWSAKGALLAGTYAAESKQHHIEAAVGVGRIAQRDYLIGSVDYLQHLQPGSSLGFGVERDAVNSRMGLEQGLSYTALALVADHAFTDRFNVGVAAGTTLFSNHNQRPILRTRWNYSLMEQYGLNAFLKTRSYHNSNPYRPQYFSPNHLNEASLGLSARLALADQVVFHASVDTGEQWSDGSAQRIWSAVFGLASARTSKVQWKLGIEATNAASVAASQSEAYRYLTAVARLSIPW